MEKKLKRNDSDLTKHAFTTKFNKMRNTKVVIKNKIKLPIEVSQRIEELLERIPHHRLNYGSDISEVQLHLLN